MPRPRYLEPTIRADLGRKMVFVSGPRQVGKTTLALRLARGRAGYLNWDIAEHRERLLRRELPARRFWVFDEIHKYRGWRDFLKGLWDGRRRGQRILVTGSGRLDFYRFGGDSLQGRYHHHRLHPFSVRELGIERVAELRDLLRLGPFPEQILGRGVVEARRWSREYRTRLLREDLTSLERVDDIGRLEELVLRLPDLVGSPLSINALREDLQVSHRTVSRWIQVLERLYAVFRVPPFGAARLRAVKKEQKHYHFDWTPIEGAGPRFENLVASHLLKWAHFLQDAEGRDVELRYFRDVDGREVDFVVTERRRPVLAVECKRSAGALDPSLRYFKERFASCEAWQIHLEGDRDAVTPEGIRIAPATALLGRLA
jgi:predicted AAA+ superfamily ATPase